MQQPFKTRNKNGEGITAKNEDTEGYRREKTGEEKIVRGKQNTRE